MHAMTLAGPVDPARGWGPLADVAAAPRADGFFEFLDYVASVTWSLADTLCSAAIGHTPALVIGLGAVAAVPVLLLAGVVVRARSRAAGPDPGGLTRIVRNPGKADKDAIGGTVGEPNTGRVTKAWRNAARPPAAMLIRVLEGDPEPGREIALGDLRVLRIGRETDNDICLRNETVHRYHAVISRSPDDGLVVSDLSGRTGNGVYVNGSRVTSQPLVDGDRLVLGRAELLVVMR